MLTKLSRLIGALTMQHMNDIRWMRSNWMIEFHAPHTITQYKINLMVVHVLSLCIYVVTDVTVSTCMSFFTNCMTMADMYCSWI